MSLKYEPASESQGVRKKNVGEALDKFHYCSAAASPTETAPFFFVITLKPSLELSDTNIYEP